MGMQAMMDDLLNGSLAAHGGGGERRRFRLVHRGRDGVGPLGAPAAPAPAPHRCFCIVIASAACYMENIALQPLSPFNMTLQYPTGRGWSNAFLQGMGISKSSSRDSMQIVAFVPDSHTVPVNSNPAQLISCGVPQPTAASTCGSGRG